MSSIDNLQKDNTALGSLAIYREVTDDNYPYVVEFCDIQPYLIIDDSVYLILWKLRLPRGMLLILGAETPPRGMLLILGAETPPRGM